MNFPICAHCDKPLIDWEGNIMVEQSNYLKGNIDKLQIICKECTREMDEKANKIVLHNMWELRWIKNNYIFLLGFIINDLTEPNPSKKWSNESLELFWKLGAQAYPELSKDPITSH